ncbi:carbohydrate-binding protein SusD [Niastella koreensis]|uniref:RagB/SusD domain-containing protein n=2 Tax=Niastella koreensis TaxID=354356 RepID=G8TM74_NIAKG|nr:RagB/SusD family nutrient uptake outer membrane protein [Niastella koreensis]AEV99847.1 RagB/SusD domain-containing protein [Niastella koreensis GR20-10]OQP51536.1 carbohydrate-binding protein SusD [Niastella koreensis]
MKRRIFLLGLLATMIAVAGSCKKFLEKKPHFLEPDNYYSNAQEVNSALAGVYDIISQETMWGGQIPIRHNATTDESFFSYTSFTTGPFRYNYDASDTYVASLWKNLYTGIERANSLLANMDKADMDANAKSVVGGEALFLRAFYYFTLVQYYGDVPLKLTPSVSVDNVDLARTPTKEVYAQIVADMKEAETLVKTATQTGSSGHVSKSTVRGILARVYLTMAGAPLHDTEKFKDARDWALKVKESGEHDLNPDYKQIFINEVQDIEDYKECIWEAECYGANNDAYKEGGRIGNENGVLCRSTVTDSIGYAYGFNSTTQKLYYLYAPTDVRRDWSISTYSMSATGVKTTLPATNIYGRNTAKWRREYEKIFPKNKNYTATNFPILRYADVLLMLAEAENEATGATALANESLNLVRRRAGLTDTAIASQDGFRDEVRNERARELCFEGLRKPDLIRWGIFVQTMHDISDEFKAKGGTTYAYAAVNAANVNDKHLLYPIPLSEMTLNKKMVQNPYW